MIPSDTKCSLDCTIKLWSEVFYRVPISHVFSSADWLLEERTMFKYTFLQLTIFCCIQRILKWVFGFFCHAKLVIHLIFFHAVWCIYYLCIIKYDRNEASSVARMLSSWNIWSSNESLMFIQLKLELFRNISGLHYRNHTSFMLTHAN